jgi:hypothetical protein
MNSPITCGLLPRQSQNSGRAFHTDRGDQDTMCSSRLTRLATYCPGPLAALALLVGLPCLAVPVDAQEPPRQRMTACETGPMLAGWVAITITNDVEACGGERALLLERLVMKICTNPPPSGYVVVASAPNSNDCRGPSWWIAALPVSSDNHLRARDEWRDFLHARSDQTSNSTDHRRPKEGLLLEIATGSAIDTITSADQLDTSSQVVLRLTRSGREARLRWEGILAIRIR